MYRKSLYGNINAENHTIYSRILNLMEERELAEIRVVREGSKSNKFYTSKSGNTANVFTDRRTSKSPRAYVEIDFNFKDKEGLARIVNSLINQWSLKVKQ